MASNTNEVTLSKCREKMNESGDNVFRISISRKDPVRTLSSRIALMDEATVEMLASPEMWLPKLFGGGLFLLSPFHVSDQRTQLGDAISVNVEGKPLSNNNPAILDVIRSPDWLGPRKLVWPSELELESARKQEIMTVTAPPGGVAGEGGRRETSVPASANPPGGSVDPRYEFALRQLEQEKATFAEKVRQIDEAKHKLELENAKREADARMAKLEAKLEAQAAGGGTRGGGMAEIIAAVAPIITPILTSQNELRKQLAESEAKAREDQSRLFTTLLERKEDGAAGMKMMMSMAESFAAVNKMGLDMIHTVKETLVGPEESPTVSVVRELGKALILFGQGAAGAGPKLKPVPQLPPKGGAKAQEAPRRAPRKGGSDPVGRIEAMIRAKLDPLIVAEALFASLEEPAMQKALAAAQGNYLALFQERLGDWVTDADNLAYVQQLASVVQSEGKRLGLIGEEGEEEDEVDEEEEMIDDVEDTDEEEVEVA